MDNFIVLQMYLLVQVVSLDICIEDFFFLLKLLGQYHYWNLYDVILNFIFLNLSIVGMMKHEYLESHVSHHHAPHVNHQLSRSNPVYALRTNTTYISN